LIAIAGTVLFLVVAVWGVGRWRYAATHVSTENARIEGHVVPVLAKVGGYVERVKFEENERIGRGDLLVQIDDEELRVRVAEAEADLALALAAAGDEGTAGRAVADAAAARARRAALEARLVSAEANQDRAEKDLLRIRELADKRIASSQQLDAAQSAAAAAQADVAAVRQEIEAARAGESSAEAGTRAAEAQRKRATTMLEEARLRLSYARVASPVSGVVAKSDIEVGQLVQAGQPLAAVVADSAIWVTANLKETETSEVRIGQPVEIEVDAYPGCTARGTVESLSPATGSMFALLPPDNATGNFTKVVQRVPVRISVSEGCGTERPLRPGLSVVVHIDAH